MHKIKYFFIILSVFLAQSVFANNMSSHYSDSRSCMTVAHACQSAKYTARNGFWFGCMKPVILGKTVRGVNVDPAAVKMCRSDKIAMMKKELAELESVR
jgi:hypothetical protein